MREPRELVRVLRGCSYQWIGLVVSEILCSEVLESMFGIIEVCLNLSQRGSFETMNHLAYILGGKTH
jgi:hypothetical protein